MNFLIGIHVYNTYGSNNKQYDSQYKPIRSLKINRRSIKFKKQETNERRKGISRYLNSDIGTHRSLLIFLNISSSP